MQVTETKAEGLKREIEIVVPASDLEAQLQTKLHEASGQAKLKGFRPGKVPLAHLRKMYGRSMMAEIVNQIVNETPRSVIAEPQRALGHAARDRHVRGRGRGREGSGRQAGLPLHRFLRDAADLRAEGDERHQDRASDRRDRATTRSRSRSSASPRTRANTSRRTARPRPATS